MLANLFVSSLVEVMFGIGFVCLLVGAFVWYWDCLFLVGGYLFHVWGGVGVGLFFLFFCVKYLY